MSIRRRLPSRLVLGIIIVLAIAGVGLAIVYLSPSETDPVVRRYSGLASHLWSRRSRPLDPARLRALVE